jgi:hypothetical protein
MIDIGSDWPIFLSAIQAFLHGQNPYLVGEGFFKVYNPFWTYIMLIPFAVLPLWTGRVLLFVVSLTAFAYSAVRLGANRWQLVLFLTSRSVIGCLYDGNIDWLVMLGMFMPPQIGLFFVLMKPQLGIGLALFWAWQAWRQGGALEMLRIFVPVTGAYLLSFIMYGLWIFNLGIMPENPYNYSTFPFMVPMGLFLLYTALKQVDKRLSIFSSPLLSPYMTLSNYSISLVALFNRPALFVMAWIALWISIPINYLLVYWRM